MTCLFPAAAPTDAQQGGLKIGKVLNPSLARVPPFLQEGKGLFRRDGPSMKETKVPGGQHDQIGWLRPRFPPDPTHLAQKDVYRHPADPLRQRGEPFLQVPAVRCHRVQPVEIAPITLTERTTKIEQLGGGLEVVPYIAAAVQDRHQAVPSGTLDRFGRRDARLLEGPDRLLHDGPGDGGAEEDRREEPSEDIARPTRVEVEAQLPGEPAASSRDDPDRVHIISVPGGLDRGAAAPGSEGGWRRPCRKRRRSPRTRDRGLRPGDRCSAPRGPLRGAHTAPPARRT